MSLCVVGSLAFEMPFIERGMRLGSSRLVSKVPLGLGTWSWGNKVLWGYDESQDLAIAETWRAAVDSGIRFFDTGDSYGTGALEGRAEALLGECREKSKVEDLVYGTKLAAYPWRLRGDSFVEALRASLARTQLETIEIAQAHWSTRNYFPLQDKAILEGLAKCYDLNLCKAVGLSNFGPEALRDAKRFFDDRGVPVAVNQVQFSLLSTRPEDTGLLAACAELGVTPVAYSPLALGALASQGTSKRPKGPRGFLFDQVLPGATELTGLLAEIAKNRRKTTAQVALNWTICKGCLPIVGARTPERIKENLGACGWRLSEAEVYALDAAAQQATKKATQNIFMTS